MTDSTLREAAVLDALDALPRETPLSLRYIEPSEDHAYVRLSGVRAAIDPLLDAVRAWRDTPHVATRKEPLARLNQRLDLAILDAIGDFDGGPDV